MGYENWKILKSEYHNYEKEYENVSEWCNESGEYFIDDSDAYYYKVKKYVPSKKSILREEYMQLQENLRRTDYITNKLAEVIDDIDAYNEMKEHYSEELSQRKIWRQRIREIEEELRNNTNES